MVYAVMFRQQGLKNADAKYNMKFPQSSLRNQMITFLYSVLLKYVTTS